MTFPDVEYFWDGTYRTEGLEVKYILAVVWYGGRCGCSRVQPYETEKWPEFLDVYEYEN